MKSIVKTKDSGVPNPTSTGSRKVLNKHSANFSKAIASSIQSSNGLINIKE